MVGDNLTRYHVLETQHGWVVALNAIDTDDCATVLTEKGARDWASRLNSVTVRHILDAFARKLTELDAKNVRLGGQALSLQDPRDIADHIHGLAYNLRVLDGDRVSSVEAIGAQAIAYLLARARVDELDITASDSEAQ